MALLSPFAFRLLPQTPPGTASAVSTCMTTPPEQPCVLLAEDDEGTLKLLEMLLRKRRVCTRVARDGREAIEALSDTCWDVLVLDMMMPVVTGWDVAEWLAQHEDRRPRSVIVLSGAERESLTSLDSSTVNAIIFKPFDVKNLTQYIVGVARRHRDDRRQARVIEEATARI
jgi:two-component system, OmpR family, alkaline phosphatase synthesis response regulator PhoP